MIKPSYVTVPIDWIISSPTRSKRRLTLRPITRDGGAKLFSARKLYRFIEDAQNAQFRRWNLGDCGDEMDCCSYLSIYHAFISCGNSSDFETGEIRAIKMLREALIAYNSSKVLLDTRKIITRKKIDGAGIPVLFVELENGKMVH